MEFIERVSCGEFDVADGYLVVVDGERRQSGRRERES